MKILYFAWLRQRIGVGEEDLSPPETVGDAAQLVEWLKTRGPGYEEAFKDTGAIKLAINQNFAAWDTPLSPNDEVAFFPPVTGG